MLYIVLDDGREIGWHVNQPSPFVEENKLVYKVVEACADGEELDFIRHRMSNLPQNIGESDLVRWYGDDAKFIAGNLVFSPKSQSDDQSEL